MLKKNMGSLDRIVRAVVGIALLAGFFLLPEAGYRNWLLLGIIPLATSMISSCPVYSLLGLSSCPIKGAK